MADQPPNEKVTLRDLAVGEISTKDRQIAELQQQLTNERDARREDKFVFIAAVVVLLDVVFFSVMPTSGGPIALLILQLLVLIPLAKRMGRKKLGESDRYTAASSSPSPLLTGRRAAMTAFAVTEWPPARIRVRRRSEPA